MPVPTMSAPWPIYAGDPASITVTVTDGENPVDLSGQTFECQWRTTVSARKAIVLTVDTTDAADGKLTVSATVEQTRQMGRSGVFDIQQVGASTVLRGATSWAQDVTR